MSAKVKAVKKGTPIKIEGCTFIGVQGDEESIRVLQTTVDALKNVTEMFKAQRIQIKCLLHIGDEEEEDG